MLSSIDLAFPDAAASVAADLLPEVANNGKEFMSSRSAMTDGVCK